MLKKAYKSPFAISGKGADFSFAGAKK